MALLSGNRGKVSVTSSVDLSVNEAFLSVLTTCIEDNAKSSGRKPSNSYTPSGMNCIRQMYYKRISTPQDPEVTAYNDIGMADTGTRRHEAIQLALQYMNEAGKRFKYIDVTMYVNKRKEQGRCASLVIQGKDGAETRLWDKNRDIKFRCDGIIYDSVTKYFYLFEFKNQISFKASGKETVDEAHFSQIIAYCALLELDAALVCYENRDNCDLYCPKAFIVSDYDKQMILSKIDECESYAKKTEVPPITTNLAPSDCKYCNYRRTCAYDQRERGRNGES